MQNMCDQKSKTEKKTVEKKTHKQKYVCHTYTRQHSPRSKRSEIPAMHSHCHAYCLLPVAGIKAVMPMFGCCSPFSIRSKILLVIVPFAQIEADARHVSYRIVCN